MRTRPGLLRWPGRSHGRTVPHSRAGQNTTAPTSMTATRSGQPYARGFGLGSRGPVRPPVAQDDLDRGGNRDREQRAEDPQERRAGQHTQDGDERVDVESATVDERLHEVVLEPLVDDDEGNP